VGGKIYCETHLFPLLRIQGFFSEVALELARQNGDRIPVLVDAYERRDSNGNPQFTRFTIYKATDRQLYEKNLLHARAVAESRLADEKEIAVLREQFIAVLGHDLRNPLGAIAGAASLLEGSSPGAREANLVGIIKGSAARMGELIENVVDFARGRLGGGMVLNRQPTLLDPILRHVVDELRTRWPEREIKTEFYLSEPIDSDAPRISQILSNLLSNALTHGSTEGEVLVRAFLESGQFELSVSNTGRPIPPQALDRLFQPFTREEGRPSQNGLGLGLYIASQIAEAHGGAVTAISNEEETRFTFRMPASQ
jgi:sigma-B regulation protein RsbU (phosphoserine phosphatase)